MLQRRDPNGAPSARLTYNLFRRRMEPELFCAVPEDVPVPSFIGGGAWDFGGRLVEEATAPRGFDAGAARQSIALNSFYVFMASMPSARPAVS